MQPGVDCMIKSLIIDATFSDGLKRVKIDRPICSDYGDFEFTFYGSFLPKPSLETFECNAIKLQDENDVHMTSGNVTNFSESLNNPGAVIPFKVNLNLDEGEITEIPTNSNQNSTTSLSNFIDLNKDKGSVLLSVNNLSNQDIRVRNHFICLQFRRNDNYFIIPIDREPF